jgi:hypothetical protein
VIKLNGGLGNQMFQYALGHIISLNYNSQLLLDKELFQLKEKTPGHTPRSFELGVFGIDNPSASKEDIRYFEQLSLLNKLKRELNLNYPKMFYEENFSFDAKIENVLPPVYLRGFFQSFKYFKNHEDDIRKLFKFPENILDENNKGLLKKIKFTSSVSIHIRRGDYVEDKVTQKFHGNCSLDYYDQAISKIKEFDKEVEFFFFSDDIKWVENEFKNYRIKKTFVGSNTGKNSWKDMLLMSQCHHNIIANSSFSWWAAWLNKNNFKKIIAPKRWFTNPEKEQYTFDLIPEEWYRI